jgi:hypothetical protein
MTTSEAKGENDATSVQKVRRDNTLEVLEVSDVQSMERLSRAEEMQLSALADYYEGVLRGDA